MGLADRFAPCVLEDYADLGLVFLHELLDKLWHTALQEVCRIVEAEDCGFNPFVILVLLMANEVDIGFIVLGVKAPYLILWEAAPLLQSSYKCIRNVRLRHSSRSDQQDQGQCVQLRL